MRIDYYVEMDRYGFPPRLRRELEILFKQHNHKASNNRRTGKPVSDKTQYRRFVNLCATLNDLKDIGYRKESVYTLKEKHVYALVSYWQEKEDGIGTIDNKLSYLRTLSLWMGKPGLVGGSRKYFTLVSYQRKPIAEKDKTWSGNCVDILAVLKKVRVIDPVVAMQLELQLAFGMRVEESMCYQPIRGVIEALDRAAINVSKGTKGGRGREVGLEDVVQIDVLERAANLAVDHNRSMIPGEYSLERWRNRYYYVMRVVGIKRDGKLQVTSHGLRHEYLNGVFARIVGKPSPVKGGGGYDAGLARMAMRIVVERAGHWSRHKSQAYLGGVLQKLQKERTAARKKGAGDGIH
ncbi:MAG TPA: Fis family transcriptional regulator [Betaproteobacteria bacterium]|nr:Fis family transcriptional regulator [Betaproteobacteria bacterium]